MHYVLPITEKPDKARANLFTPLFLQVHHLFMQVNQRWKPVASWSIPYVHACSWKEAQFAVLMFLNGNLSKHWVEINFTVSEKARAPLSANIDCNNYLQRLLPTITSNVHILFRSLPMISLLSSDISHTRAIACVRFLRTREMQIYWLEMIIMFVSSG